VFFGGLVAAHADVGPFGLLRRPPGEGGGPADAPTVQPARGGGARGSGFSAGLGGGMGGGRSGGLGRDGGEHSGRGGGRTADSGAEAPRGTARGGGPQLPHQTLRISFTNRGAVPVQISITELRSLIGNFVPQPEQLTLAPGATAALDPVSGDAGGNLESLDVAVTLQHERITDPQVLHLHPRPPAAPAP